MNTPINESINQFIDWIISSLLCDCCYSGHRCLFPTEYCQEAAKSVTNRTAWSWPSSMWREECEVKSSPKWYILLQTGLSLIGFLPLDHPNKILNHIIYTYLCINEWNDSLINLLITWLIHQLTKRWIDLLIESLIHWCVIVV